MLTNKKRYDIIIIEDKKGARVMSFHKAIASGKEHRIEYGTKGQPYCKAVDPTCRNHGSCPWCLNNRTAKNNAKKKVAENEIKKFKKGIDND